MILVSGGFDPIHEGHLDYIEEASEYGRVIVALNSDDWLIRKKGWFMQSWSSRARILKSLRIVYDVIQFNDDDNTVCDALRRVIPFYFANGGDRTTPNPEEHIVCQELGIQELFNIGGGKTFSSSELVSGHR